MNVRPTTALGRWRPVVVYITLIGVGIGIFFLIRHFGEKLNAPAQSAAELAEVTAQSPTDVVFHVLATLAAIIALGNLLSLGFRSIGQPAVIGEVIAGIVLGPSVLGAIAPDAMHILIPSPADDPHGQVISALKTIAQLGVVLYMFVVGLELNIRKVAGQARAAIAISHASIVLPFVLGSGLALWLYPVLSSNHVQFTSFALFIGVAMAITAFPVLARILTDRRLEKTELGVIALSCAATDDVTAWCLLAFVVGVARAQVSGALLVAACSILFIALMVFAVRPVAARLIRWADSRDVFDQAVPLLFIAVLCSALATELIGIHAVFGAFLLGAIIPHDSRLADHLSHKLYDVVTILLLPAFFAITGMNTHIDLIRGAESWLICIVIIFVATAGKFGGTLLAARLTGVPWRTSLALGVLMNTRGLMELIVLNVGLQLGVISHKLFAMMVLMALVTTIATAPILRWLVPSKSLEPAA